jgi:GLPGLI family protein
MKQFTMIFGTLLAFALGSQAQMKQGQVVYERKINLHKRLPPEAEQMRAMIPEFQSSKMELLFTESASLFRRVKEEEAELPTAGGDGGPRMVFRAGGPGGDAETYRNYNDLRVVTSQELGPKKYLVDDTLAPLKWKLEADTMTIAGYLCTKATTSILAPQRMNFRTAVTSADGQTKSDSVAAPKPTNTPVTVWFAEGIESQAGPENYYGLPGLILKVDVDNGWMVYTPVTMSALGNGKVEPPTAGKKITKEELRKMQQEQMRNFGNGMRGGATMRVVQ